MGLIQKKDDEEREVIEGVEIIERSDVPDDLPQADYDLVAGESAEDIAAGSADETGDGAGHAEPAVEGDGSEQEDGDAAAADDEEPADASGAAASPSRRVPAPLVAVAVVAVIAAAAIGYLVGSGSFGRKGADSASLTSDQLDCVIASYAYGGSSHDITARQVIEAQYSLDAVEQEDGTYPTPSADTALSYARNQILLAEADQRGITVSDEEMADFAEQSLGTSDYATMAEQYQLSEDQAREVVRQQVTLRKLYDQVVPESDATAPTAPTEPENGDTSTRSKEYADYIIGLLGDEWDAESGTWASEDGDFYAALSGTDFSADSASYEQALTAYYVAYQKYAEQSSGYAEQWSEFQNGLFADADIDLYGLFA